MAEIESVYTTRRLSVTVDERDCVQVEVLALSGKMTPFVGVDRADFLAAVASELNVRIVPADAIVIERSELPAVEVIGGDVAVAGPGGPIRLYSEDTVERSMVLARAWAAAAEYLTANPPLDEAQVAALTAVFYRLPNAPSPDDAADMSRALIATGRVQVTS